jgi:hypothetical protein
MLLMIRILVKTDPQPISAADRYFRTGTGQPDPAERAVSAGLI